jgi:hypothetical protein
VCTPLDFFTLAGRTLKSRSMNKRKTEIREVILDIISGRAKTKYPPTQVGNLLTGVAEVLNRRAGKAEDSQNVFPHNSELEYDDKLLAQEIFWDLIVERIITPGWDFPNSELPFFRVHSEAKERLNKLK